MGYQKYIKIDNEIRFGKPSIIGTRVTVLDVLALYSRGMTTDEILEDFPKLKKEQLLACLSYVAEKECTLITV